MKILYLISKYYHDCKMDMGRLTHGLAISRHREVTQFAFWGTGWPGYDSGRTLRSNLDATGRDPDVIICYKPQDHLGVPLVGVPRVLPFNDCYDKKTLDDLRGAEPNLIVLHHENDKERPWWKTVPDAKFVHIPHCADKDIFYRENYGDRPIDVLLTGAASEKVYPLRQKFATLIRSGQVRGEIRVFPGHRQPNRESTQRQFEDYAAHLRRAKIVLCDSSIYRYALAKYVEAMAAGCLVVGDMPDDERYYFQSTQGRHIRGVSPAVDLRALAAVVNGLLEKPDTIREMALAGRQAYLDAYTTDHYAARLVWAIHDGLDDKPKADWTLPSSVHSTLD